jgi:phosphate transport system protein
MTRHYFDIELEKLNHDLIEMGVLVEDAMDKSIVALKNKDKELAKSIYDHDDLIDDMENVIERRCLNLIARQQPLAKDLRTVTTALKIITDLERIGDHASDIAEITINMVNQKYIKPLIDIPKMAELAKIMVHDAITAYVNSDKELALKVCLSDDPVDDLFDKIVLELVGIMKNDISGIDQIINFMFIAKYLERMADHATNIAEWVIYNITGTHDPHLARHTDSDIIVDNNSI